MLVSVLEMHGENLLTGWWHRLKEGEAPRVETYVPPAWNDTLDMETRMALFFNDINRFNELYPQEKVFLHFDNTSYFLEETIWFKAYVVSASDNRPSSLSRVLYVELLSPEGAVLETRKLPVEEGQCHGEFHLDSLYLPGYFEVRAYTRYMLNFGEDAIFSRVFPVYRAVADGDYGDRTIMDRDLSRRNRSHSYRQAGEYSLLSYLIPPSKKAREQYYYEPLPRWDPKKRRSTVAVDEAFDEARREKTPDPVLVEFFPEGGVLVKGARQRVAFTISDREGRGLNLSGAVYDTRGRQVAHLTPVIDGSGDFTLLSTGEKYTARLRYGGKEYRFPLPECYESGCALAVEEPYRGDSLNLVCHYVPGELFNDSLVAVALSCRGRIYRFFVVRAEGLTRLPVAREWMPEGVNTVTIFDREGRALAQRCCFVRQERGTSEAGRVRMDIVHDGPLAGQDIPMEPYAAQRVVLRCSDSQGSPLKATFSLSVRDRETDDVTYYTDDCYTWMLLSSELHGYIKQAAYYFERDDRLHRMHLDLLMLTRGWCRYQWENMNLRYKEEGWTQPIEKGLMVDGSIHNMDRLRKPRLKNADVSYVFYNTDTTRYIGRLQGNELGNYALQLTPFYGEAYVSLLLSDYALHRSHMMTLNRWFSPTPRPISYYELNLPDESMEMRVNAQVYQIRDSLLQFSLPEVSITRKNRRRRIQHQYSLRHYDISEELEYMYDTYKIRPGVIVRHPDTLVMSIMDRYNFPPNIFNTVFATRYPSDTEIPEGKLYWQTYRYRDKIRDMKEIVIRSEPEMLEAFYLPQGKAQVSQIDRDLIYRPRHEGLGIKLTRKPSRFKVENFAKDDEKAREEEEKEADELDDIPDVRDRGGIVHNDRRPDCIAVFIPKEKDEPGMVVPTVMGQRRTLVKGFSYSKDFVSPDYRGRRPEQLPADHRRTLYWNPDLTTDENGSVSVEFFNSSDGRFITLDAEGLTPDGQPVVLKQ